MGSIANVLLETESSFGMGTEMAREIPLTRGKVAIVDDEDIVLVSKFVWYADWTDFTRKWYVAGHLKIFSHAPILMHRLIADAPKGSVVDHFDGDGLNNRRSNLRLATHAQNIANQVGRQRRSGFKGVSQHTASPHRFGAYISGKRGSVYIASFGTPEEAARAYDDAARAKYGEFACFNFPRPGERSALTGKIEPVSETSEGELVKA